jgi:hypothetical protein
VELFDGGAAEGDLAFGGLVGLFFGGVVEGGVLGGGVGRVRWWQRRRGFLGFAGLEDGPEVAEGEAEGAHDGWPRWWGG